jgi:hypothetical protein
MIKSKNIHPNAPAKYVVVSGPIAITAADGTNELVYVWPFATKGKLVDLILGFHSGAADATTIKVLPKKNNSAALCATDAIFTIATGASQSDTKGALTLGANNTRPVLSATAASLLFSKGDRLTVDNDRTGGSAVGVGSIAAVFEAQE